MQAYFLLILFNLQRITYFYFIFGAVTLELTVITVLLLGSLLVFRCPILLKPSSQTLVSPENFVFSFLVGQNGLRTISASGGPRRV